MANRKSSRRRFAGGTLALVGAILLFVSLAVRWGTWHFPSGSRPWVLTLPAALKITSSDPNDYLGLFVILLLVFALLAGACAVLSLRRNGYARAASWWTIGTGALALVDALLIRRIIAKITFDWYPPEGGYGHISWGAWLATTGAVAIVTGGVLSVVIGRGDRGE